MNSGSGVQSSGDSMSVDINQREQPSSNANILRSNDDRLHGRASGSSASDQMLPFRSDAIPCARHETMGQMFFDKLDRGGVDAAAKVVETDFQGAHQSNYFSTLNSLQIVALGAYTKNGQYKISDALEMAGRPDIAANNRNLRSLLDRDSSDGLSDAGRKFLEMKRQREIHD